LSSCPCAKAAEKGSKAWFWQNNGLRIHASEEANKTVLLGYRPTLDGKNWDFQPVKEQFLTQLKVRQTIIFGIVFVKVVARHQLGPDGGADESR
jgi:hypothetical protein